MALIQEAGVINTTLILQSARAQAEDDGLPPSEVANIDLRKLWRLDLSFQTLTTTNKLSFGGLSNLRVLKLDNNKLERVDGLEMLAGTLETLDLSFNNISNLGDSLHSLRKLNDLSLANNKLTGTSLLGALDGQQQSLEVLSLGNNNLFLPATLIYLNRFPELRALSLASSAIPASTTTRNGNNVAAVAGAKKAEGGNNAKQPAQTQGGAAAAPSSASWTVTKEIILAALPRLSFLDYTMTTGSEKKLAEDSHTRVLGDLKAEIKRAMNPTKEGGEKKGAFGEDLIMWMGGGSLDEGEGKEDEGSEFGAAVAPGGSPGRAAARSPKRDRGSISISTGEGGEGGAPPARSPDRISSDRDVFEAGLGFVANLEKIVEDPKALMEIANVAATMPNPLALSGAAMLAPSAVPATGTAGGLTSRPPETARESLVALQANEALVMRIPGPIKEKLAFLRETVAFSVDSTIMRGLALYSEQVREVIAATSVLDSYLEMDPSLSILHNFNLQRKKSLKDSNIASLAQELKEDQDDSALLSSLSGGDVSASAEASLSSALSRRHRARLAHSASYYGGAPQASSSDDASGSSKAMAREEEDLRERATLVVIIHLLERATEVKKKLVESELELHDQAMSILLELDAAWRDIESKRSELFLKLFRDCEKAVMTVGEDLKAVGQEASDEYQEHSALMLSSFSNKRPGSAATAGGVGGGEGPMSGMKGMEDKASSSAEAASAAGGPVYDEEMAILLGDKEAVMSAITMAIDSRLSRALTAEKETTLGEKKRYAQIIRARIAAEAERHRSRMTEVESAVKEVEASLTNLMEGIIGEEEEEEEPSAEPQGMQTGGEEGESKQDEGQATSEGKKDSE
jgi:hypothetical protein